MKVLQTDCEITFTFKNIPLQLTNTDDFVWRLTEETEGSFDKFGAAQCLSRDIGEEFIEKTNSLSVTENGDKTIVTAPDGSYAVLHSDYISFHGKNGKRKRKIISLIHSDDSSEISFELIKDEKLYGTGERFNRVNQRGKKIDIYATDRWCGKEGNSYIPIPIIISSKSSGLFFNRYEPAIFDLGKTRKKITVTQKNAPLDMYIFLHDTQREILKAYCSITGFAPMPPSWAFGTFVCRYHPEFGSPEGVLKMAEEMEKNDFPWEAVIMEGWGIYNFSRWDELKKLSDTLHKKGKKMMVYEPCGKIPRNGHERGITDSHAVKCENGTELKQTYSLNLLDNFKRKTMRCIDITSKEARDKWYEMWDYLVKEVNVDGAKIDFCEQFPDTPDVTFADGRDSKNAHHWYPTYYNILRYNHFNEKAEGGVNFSRGGGIGTQRYPFVWAGDQRREMNFLKSVVTAALSLGLSGVPFVSWDMAGYRSAFLPYDKIMEHQVFLRALEFTAFSPNIQTHGTVKRPYDFDSHTRDIYRAYTKLHDTLRPYIVEQAKISCETGLPMMRHLILHYPCDEKVYTIEDEYMFGESLLIAPILGFSNRRNIYLPKGKWQNIFTGKVFEGNKTIKNYKVPLECVPVFVNLENTSEALTTALNDGKIYIDSIGEFWN